MHRVDKTAQAAADTPQRQPAAGRAPATVVLSTFLEERAGAVAQRELLQVTAPSPRVGAQRPLNTSMDNSPRMAAQRQQLRGIFGGGVQRQGGLEDEEPVKDGVAVNDDQGLECEADVMSETAAMVVSKAAGQEVRPDPLTRMRRNAPEASRPPSDQSEPMQRATSTFGSVVQRNIGFEFETNEIRTRRVNGLPWPPAGGFPDGERALASWNRGLQIAKGTTLLRRTDVEVQADEIGSNSDLEVVTTHFPEDDGGRQRLRQALLDLQALGARFNVLGQQAGWIVPARALDGVGGFSSSTRTALMLGDWSTARTAPQVTMGLRLQNVGNIVRDLHEDAFEAPGERQLRDPGRVRMRGSNVPGGDDPRALGDSEGRYLVDGAALARQAINAYRQQFPHSPGDVSGLEGLLTIIFAYAEAMPHKVDFLKSKTPFMAKTDLATMWTTLPEEVQAYYGGQAYPGRTRFERLIAQAPGYEAKLGQPLFPRDLDLAGATNAPQGQEQWYHRLGLATWVRGIAADGVDQLTQANFPHRPRDMQVEGYGALGEKMDKHGGNGETPLPVFELRSATNRVTYAEAQQWALDVFDYIVSLNDNPDKDRHGRDVYSRIR